MKLKKKIILLFLPIFLLMLNTGTIIIKAVDESNLNQIFLKSFDSEVASYLLSVVNTKDNYYVAVGSIDNVGEKNLGWIVKVDDQGNTIFSNKYKAPLFNDVNDSSALLSIQESDDGGYIACGRTYEKATGNTDGWIIKVDANGNEIFSKQYNSIDHMEDYFTSILKTSDGNYILSGATSGTTTNGSPIGNQDGWILKIDANGNEIFSYQYGGTNNDYLSNIAENKDGSFIIVGSSASDVKDGLNKGSGDGWVLKIDANGHELNSWLYGTDRYDHLSKVIIDQDNNIYAVGDTEGVLPKETSPGGIDGWVLKLSYDGNVLFSKQYGNEDYEFMYGLTQDSNGDLMIAGLVYRNSSTDNDHNAFILNVDAKGNQLLYKEYGTKNVDLFYTITKTKDNDYILVGLYNSPSENSNGNGWILKLGFRLAISYDNNGGQGQMSNQETKFSQTTKLSKNTFTKEGYEFKGWATSKENAQKGLIAYQNEASFVQSDKEDHVLYAVWQKVENNDNNNDNNGNNNDKQNDDNKVINPDKGKILPKTGNDYHLLIITSILVGLSLLSIVNKEKLFNN
ncbi:MAG: InlB B-repeat-containing protein [Bacilli bacterium]|nr:InlB B-repeat-containing protein [Bacilli bacterium]